MRRTISLPGRGGFTLIEVAVATVVIGIGVTSLLLTVGSGTRINSAAQELTRAVFCAQEIREWTLKLPFSDTDPADMDNPPGPDGSNPQVFVDDLDDLMDVTYAPPRDGQGSPIADMVGWTQQITLTWRDPSDLLSTVEAGTSDVIYVSVQISRHGREVLTVGWLVTRRD